MAVIEDGVNESVDLTCDILDVVEHELAHRASKESVLLNVDDAVVRHDPDIEIPVDEVLKEKEPRVQKEDACSEDEEGEVGAVAEEVRGAVLDREIDGKGEQNCKDEPNEEGKHGKPMTTKEEDRPFVVRGIEDATEVDHVRGREIGRCVLRWFTSRYFFVETRITEERNDRMALIELKLFNVDVR